MLSPCGLDQNTRSKERTGLSRVQQSFSGCGSVPNVIPQLCSSGAVSSGASSLGGLLFDVPRPGIRETKKAKLSFGLWLGRETGLREKPFVRLPAPVRAVRESLRPYLHNPSAFFGHTMGALISFELSRELRRTLWRWFRMRTWKASGASFPRPLRAAWPSQRPISKRASTCRSISSPPPRSSRAQKPPRCTRDRSWAPIASWRATRPTKRSLEFGRSCSASSRSAFTTTFLNWVANRCLRPKWSCVRVALQTELPLHRFFEGPTIAQLATAMLVTKP